MSPILDIRGLTVSLPKQADRPYAIKDITFSVNAGEIVCVVGGIRFGQVRHLVHGDGAARQTRADARGG